MTYAWNLELDKNTKQAGAELQRWKKGWSTGALLPEGNGPDHSWQKDSVQVYRTCLDFYKKGYLSHLFSWTNEE